MTKDDQYQYIVEQYEKEHGYNGAELRKVADWAVKKGLAMLPKVDPVDILAKQIKNSLRAERKTHNGRSYRNRFAVKTKDFHGKQGSLWLELEKSPEDMLERAFNQRREAIVGESHQLYVDVNVYNDLRSRQYELELDFTPDIDEREWEVKNVKAS